MIEVALGQLVWLLIGITIGAAGTWCWLRTRSEAKIAAALLLPAPAAEPAKVLITVDWALINTALAGSGYIAVPKDSIVQH